MNQDQPPLTDEQSHTACRLCGWLKAQMHGNACAECVEGTLLKHLPILKRVLEEKYGPVLDRWLAGGRFVGAKWKTGINLYLCRERLKDLIRELVRNAVAKGEIQLQLPRGKTWKPIQAHQLLDSVQKQCEEGIQSLLASLFLAISNAPTEEAERELIEVASGKKRINKRYVREEAISVIVLTEATPPPVRALLEIRYRTSGGRFSYTKVVDGQVNPIWLEIKDTLPEEVAELICNEPSED